MHHWATEREDKRHEMEPKHEMKQEWEKKVGRGRSRGGECERDSVTKCSRTEGWIYNEMSGRQGYVFKVQVSNLCGSTFQHHFPSHFISLFKCIELRNAASMTAWPTAGEELITMCMLGPGGWVRTVRPWNPIIAAKCLSFRAEKRRKLTCGLFSPHNLRVRQTNQRGKDGK